MKGARFPPLAALATAVGAEQGKMSLDVEGDISSDPLFSFSCVQQVCPSRGSKLLQTSPSQFLSPPTPPPPTHTQISGDGCSPFFLYLVVSLLYHTVSKHTTLCNQQSHRGCFLFRKSSRFLNIGKVNSDRVALPSLVSDSYLTWVAEFLQNVTRTISRNRGIVNVCRPIVHGSSG